MMKFLELLGRYRQLNEEQWGLFKNSMKLEEDVQRYNEIKAEREKIENLEVDYQ